MSWLGVFSGSFVSPKRLLVSFAVAVLSPSENRELPSPFISPNAPVFGAVVALVGAGAGLGAFVANLSTFF